LICPKIGLITQQKPVDEKAQAAKPEKPPRTKTQETPEADEAASPEGNKEASPQKPKTSAALGFYDQSTITPLPSDCKSPSVLFTVIPKSIHEKPSFRWRFALQVMLANQQLKTRDTVRPHAKSPEVSFHTAGHTPTGGVGLLARCNNGEACNELMAAYQLVVPTAKLQSWCGDDPKTLSWVRPETLMPPPEWDIETALPARDDPTSQCVRLAACEAQKTGKLVGDPAIQCQKKPGKFKIGCALKYPCAKVLSCVAGE